MIMDKICHIDFETVGEALKARGATAYAQDFDTEILCLAYQLDQHVRVWVPPAPVPVELRMVAEDPSYIFSAFNVRFEKAVWRNLMMNEFGLPDIPDERWHDVQATCANKALPITLEMAAAVAGVAHQKDVDASRYVVSLSKRDENGFRPVPDMKRVTEYCRQDVRTQNAVHDCVGVLSTRERQVWDLDQKINDRGVLIDLKFVNSALRVVDKVIPPLIAELTGLTGTYVKVSGARRPKSTVGLTPGQRGELQKWLAKKGLELPNMRAETLDRALLRTDLAPDVHRALQIRSDVSSTSITKYRAMRDGVCWDDRARDLMQYHAASTGRWGGRRINPLNFPRGIGADPEELVEDIMSENPDLLREKYGNPIDALSSALRHAIVAPKGKRLVVGDFAGIEARLVLALAGQYDKTALMASGVDVYASMAETIYRRPINKNDNPAERQAGKNAVLGCGYQVGAKTFREKWMPESTLEECQNIVTAYREGWAPMVPKLWGALQEASLAAMQDRTPRASFGITWTPGAKWMTAFLPCGGNLWFPDPKVGLQPMPWSTPENEDHRPCWSYLRTDASRRERKTMYGGILTQNVVEALARDLLVRAMLKCEKAGMPVVLCVHDEIVCEADGDRSEELESIMSERAEWADKMMVPIAAEVWSGPRYRK